MTRYFTEFSKEQIEEIINSLPAGLDGIICYGTSHYNKATNHLGQRYEAPFAADDNIVELYDKDCTGKYDLWGEYNKKEKYLKVVAWFDHCGWDVVVKLFDDHFELEKNRTGLINAGDPKFQEKYKNKLQEIFAKNQELERQ